MRHSIARRRAARADATNSGATTDGGGEAGASGALAASGRTARLSDTRKAQPDNERHNRLRQPWRSTFTASSVVDSETVCDMTEPRLPNVEVSGKPGTPGFSVSTAGLGERGGAEQMCVAEPALAKK